MRFGVKDAVLIISMMSAERDNIRAGAGNLWSKGLMRMESLLHLFKDLDVGEDHLESGLWSG